MNLVLGVDAGGTASRAVVATVDGLVAGHGTAGPGNPTSAGPAAAHAIGAAVRAALGDHDPARVTAAFAGLAGAAVLAGPVLAAAFADEWRRQGLTCPVTIVGDAVTAFAAGTPAPSGSVLIAGTGAVAARITDRRVDGTADGLGWLLGDEGSGLWLGLQAVRAVARTWPPAPGDGLAARVAAHAGACTRDDLVHWAMSRPPAEFSTLAPLVCRSAAAGDPLAARLTTEAGDRLAATLRELPPPDGPVVLAGSLLTRNTPVRAAVLARLPDAVVATGDPAAAAAWLALCRFTTPAPAAAARLHARLLGQTGLRPGAPGGRTDSEEAQMTGRSMRAGTRAPVV